MIDGFEEENRFHLLVSCFIDISCLLIFNFPHIFKFTIILKTVYNKPLKHEIIYTIKK
jgi:hypothetical protein